MNQQPKTAWRTGANPFSAVAKPAKKHPSGDDRGSTSPADLQISDDPLPSHRAERGNKYDAIFKALKPGQCVVCPPGSKEVGRVSNALRKWHQVRGCDVVVKSCRKYPTDGQGRVWLVEIKGAKNV